jgi:hypothetical protein
VTGNSLVNFCLLVAISLSVAAFCWAVRGFFSAAASLVFRAFQMFSLSAQHKSQILLMFFVCRPQCHLQVLIVVSPLEGYFSPVVMLLPV